MRLFTLLTAAVFSVVVRADSNTAATAASAASVPSSSAVAVSASSFTNVTLQTTLSASLSEANHYGAPIPPWEVGSYPGWYYGTDPGAIIGWVLPWLLDDLLCAILDLLPGLHCPVPKPPPKNGWVQTFSNLDGATQADDYLTYGLVDTIEDCEAMCLNVQGCNFINTYHDVNGKNGSPQLTCSLFSLCHDASDADNKGGQTQPDGSVDYITDSNGFCLHS
ncbi:hypothetical protein EV359DRAFT_61494 [Lentinula novae-zelandiae]|nr:hypothetical protein EV359DRAFT_61494 [Lentinula novae-zelandiae]